MDDPGPSRLYLKNLSFGVSKGTVVASLSNHGFWVTVDDVHIWRTGSSSSVAQRKMCTGFIKMASWDDVDAAIRLLNGRLVPELSSCALHAERALPRMSSLKKKEQLPVTTEPKGDETPSSTVPTEGEYAVYSMMKVKEEMKNEVKRKKEFEEKHAVSSRETPWARRMKARQDL